MFKTTKYCSESFTKLTLQGFIAAKTWKNYIVPYQNKLFKNLTCKQYHTNVHFIINNGIYTRGQWDYILSYKLKRCHCFLSYTHSKTWQRTDKKQLYNFSPIRAKSYERIKLSFWFKKSFEFTKLTLSKAFPTTRVLPNVCKWDVMTLSKQNMVKEICLFKAALFCLTKSNISMQPLFNP